ncbi:MAG: DNA/RNA nuclease SfsA, partial [Candidatus Bathyarchaeota archaeon]|nr:DNA/RNA nuclease SfsA [Candidatus Bathyarchaeota archaeon]
MRFEGSLLPAIFRARPNRFLGVVEVNGKRSQCYIPNPGRMGELLYPGARTYLLERRSENRKTLYDLVLVDLGGTLVSIDSRVPNKVVADAIESDQIPEFIGLHIEKQEYTFGDSRLDFLLRGGWSQLLLEVKSCTLVRDGTGL